MGQRLPIRALPILETWDCNSCGHCCRGTTIVLDDSDLNKLEQQRWTNKSEFKNRKLTARESLLGGRTFLAKKDDGSCVFLNEQNRCVIHEQFGEDAKPAMCRAFPFQVVPLEKHANLTLRYACPSATLGKGTPLEERVKAFRKSDLAQRFVGQAKSPPRIVSRHKATTWKSFMAASESLQRLLSNSQMPMVRRVVHGLRFCQLLDAANLSQHDEKTLLELFAIFEASAPEDVGEVFRDRAAPTSLNAFLFRQAAVHSIRCLPAFPYATSMWQRLRLLWLSFRMARGAENIPPMHAGFQANKLSQLDGALGPLTQETLEPLNRFFEGNVSSLKYAIVHGNRPLVDSFRELALAFPTGLWMLRLLSGDQTPTREQMQNVVIALDRAQGAAAITKAASLLAKSNALERLIAWYAR